MSADWDAQIAREASASLQWRMICSELYAFEDETCMSAGILPTQIPFLCLDDTEVRFDPVALLRSTQSAGTFYVVNCSCGYAGDVGLGGSIFISHPDAGLIVWEIGRRFSDDIIQPEFRGEDGFLRWVFERKDYEAQVKAMLETAKDWVHNPRRWPEIKQLLDPNKNFDPEAIRRGREDGACFSVDSFEPSIAGDDTVDIENAQIESISQRQPVVPADAVFEFGYIPEDDGFCRNEYRVNFTRDKYIERYFLRGAVKHACDLWGQSVYAYWTLPKGYVKPRGVDPNIRCKLPDTDMQAVHAAGHEFVEVFRQALLESGADPGITTRYLEYDLPVARPA